MRSLCWRGLLFLALLSLALQGCGGSPHPDADSGIFRAPTAVVVTPTVENLPTAPGEAGQSEELLPTPTPVCSNDLVFLDDLTIPDGTVVEPGQRLDKRWKVQNNGTCNWDDRYRVKLIAGPNLGVPVQQALYPALSGTEIVIRMIFIAPEDPGNYRSAWQAFDPQDNPFGHPFFIDFQVAGEDDNP